MQTEARWNRLLDKIEAGKVIPIIGRELVTIPVDGDQVEVYRYVATELARRLSDLGPDPIPEPADDPGALDPINEVALTWLASGGELRDLYDELGEVMRGLDGIGAPPALRQLAEIEGFALFVTTTFDGLMETAVREARRSEPTVVNYYPTAQDRDLPKLWESTPNAFVYHLMGRYAAESQDIPEFAMTEEETLEFVHSLQRKPGGPEQLFKELGEKQLLMLGVTFPDWLMRFLIRMSNGDRRLARAMRGRATLPRKAAHVDPKLITFLEHYSPGFDILDEYTPTSFVQELHERWRKHREAKGSEEVSSAPPKDVFVFLSYASEDRQVVEQIRAGLKEVGITAWFDEDRLEGGDNLKNVIRSAIQRCTLFVIVLSRNSLTQDARWFRMEWKWAEEVTQMLPANRAEKFVVPVMVDEAVTPHDERIDPWIRNLKWIPDDRFLADALELFRTAVQEAGRSA